jgi:hypothetical protein
VSWVNSVLRQFLPNGSSLSKSLEPDNRNEEVTARQEIGCSRN